MSLLSLFNFFFFLIRVRVRLGLDVENQRWSLSPKGGIWI